SVLEQNTDRSRMEDRWSGGESVEIGWQPEHCLVLD
ncbi:TOBE domain-containing protein, partial [Streptomyces lunaelactis]|nr:TOBE domain-containing protein [Streptomyces lunaelactis]